VKVKEVIKLIQMDGWYLLTTKESHSQYKHPVKQGRVTIPGKLNEELHPKTLTSVLRQAGIK